MNSLDVQVVTVFNIKIRAARGVGWGGRVYMVDQLAEGRLGLARLGLARSALNLVRQEPVLE